MPLALPDGARCFIDANIVYYHFVDTKLVSDPCSDLLQRVLEGSVVGVTSTHVLAEAVHKVMVAEAAHRFAITRAGLVGWLQSRPHRISELTDFVPRVASLRQMNLEVLSVGLDVLEAAAEVCQSAGLLMNDATTVAMMRREGIIDLATNDNDFDRVAGLRVWKPR